MDNLDVGYSDIKSKQTKPFFLHNAQEGFV